MDELSEATNWRLTDTKSNWCKPDASVEIPSLRWSETFLRSKSSEPTINWLHYIANVCYLESQHLHTTILSIDEATFNRDEITNTSNSHVWCLDNNTRGSTKNTFRTLSWVTYGAALLTSGRLYFKSGWHASATSVPWRCSDSHRVRTIVTERWLTPSWRLRRNCISQSIFSKPLNWTVGPLSPQHGASSGCG
jgi:hypothetical protein